MRTTPHDYYLEVLERVLLDVPYTEDEVTRILRACGVAWEVLFKGAQTVADPEPTEWEAAALTLIFEGIRKALDEHPANVARRASSGGPPLRLLKGGK